MPGMQLSEAKAKMADIRTGLRREVDQINANPNYSDHGRAREVAASVLAHRKRAQQLRDKFTNNNDTIRIQLTAKLFGVPVGADASTILAYRDAEDRAAKLTTSDEAKATLNRALERGDSLLARAIAGHAYGKKWHEIAETYAEAKDLTRTLDELTDIPTGSMNRIAEAALFTVRAPQELDVHLGGQSDTLLRRFLDEQAS